MEHKETLQEKVLAALVTKLQADLNNYTSPHNFFASIDSEGKVSLSHQFWPDLAKSVEYLVYHAVRAGRYTTFVFGWTARQRLKVAEDYLQELYEAALAAEALK